VNAPTAAANPTAAGPFRRIAALVYDSLLLLAVLFLGTVALLPLTGGESLTPDHIGAWALAYRGFVVLLVIVFFGVFWTRRGQTLGMMSWKIRIETASGACLDWPRVALRLGLGLILVVALTIGLWLLRGDETPLATAGSVVLLAPVAINYLWMLRDPARRTLQDVLSGCRVVRVG
jgi:uncharacterized RDD family membrane protein YckC